VPRPLLTYRYHAASCTGGRGVPAAAIFKLRIDALCEQVAEKGEG
jgi:hypothetical protein